jgi:3-deoxy-D-manno-octulosonate 8-phosphate phosphatase (KDO 8-P phosphatase)
MNSLASFKKINVFVFDIDGVLTNGQILVLPNGVMARSMNVKDGYALQLAIKKGYKVVIISGGFSQELLERFELLGVKDVYLKVSDKVRVLTDYIHAHNLSLEHTLFMGDDLPDFDAMKLTALPCCPNDAVQEIKSISTYISPLNGGAGCVRDVIEKLMKLQNNWHHENHVAAK